MGPGVLAFSISNKIEQIGAICGFAAILGLAVLSVLYFSQAREVKRLREWAGRAPERDAELQARVTEEASRRAGQAPVADDVPPATTPAASAQAKPVPSAAAPATAAATAAGAQAVAAGTQATAAGAQATAAGAQAASGAQATAAATGAQSKPAA